MIKGRKGKELHIQNNIIHIYIITTLYNICMYDKYIANCLYCYVNTELDHKVSQWVTGHYLQLLD